MELALLFAVIAAVALSLHLTRQIPLLALLVLLAGSIGIQNALAQVPSTPSDFVGLTLFLDPGAKLLLQFSLALTGVLALLSMFRAEPRESVSLFFWVWLPWLAALVVESFQLAALFWGFGLYALALTLAPRRVGRVGGAANYLVIIVLSISGLLLANRFFELYPVTPEQTNLIQTGVLFLSWSFGLALAIVPLHLWLGALADEASPPVVAALTALGQPVGLWLLFSLMRKYLWLTERSDLLALLQYAGIACIVIGGIFIAAERRGRRTLAYASLFTLGLVLLDLGRARFDLLLMSGLELYARATAVSCLAAGLVLFRLTGYRFTQAAGIGAVALSGAALVGFPMTPAFVAHLPVWTEFAASDTRTFGLIAVGTLGVWIGVIRLLNAMVTDWSSDRASGHRAHKLIGGHGKSNGRVQTLESSGSFGSLLEPVQHLLPAEALAVVESAPMAQTKSTAEGQSRQQVEGEPVREAEIGSDRPESVRSLASEGEQASKEPTLASPGDPRTQVETSKEEDGYDPVQALGTIIRSTALRVRAAAEHGLRLSPRVLHATRAVAGSWPAWVGIGVVAILMVAIVAVGVYPTLVLDPLTTALGHPDYIK